MTIAVGRGVRYRFAASAALIAATAVATWLAGAPASARPFDPEFVQVREKLRQRFRETPGGTWEVRSSARMRAEAVVAFPDAPASDLTEDTVLRFRSGTFEFASRLGDAVNFRPGATRLVFRTRSEDGSVVKVRARFWTLPAGGTHVELRLRGTGVPLVSDAERGGATGTRRLALDAAARLDGVTVHFAGDGTAQVASQMIDVLGDQVPLTAVDYSARVFPVEEDADANDPTLEVTAPVGAAVISGAAVALAGTARDDQSLASITMSLNGAAPDQLDFTTRDGTAGLGSVETDFAAALSPKIGTNALTVVVADGAGNTAQRTITFVYSVPRSVSVSVGSSHSLFVVDGELYGCGWNAFGQCGDGSRVAKSTPTKVPGLTGVRAVAAGGNHSLVLLEDGALLAMGDNRYGQLGDGTHDVRTTPTPVSGLGSGVVAVAAMFHHSVAVKADGTVWTWGQNSLGVAGNDIYAPIDLPMQVGSVEGATQAATGVYHAVVLAGDGTVWGVGQGVYGVLGAAGYAATATQIPGFSGVATVQAGPYHTMVLHTDGTVSGCGQNGSRLFGTNRTDKTTPVVVPDLSGVTGMTNGYYFALFLDAGGSLRARGTIGQLTGPTGDFETDTLVTTAPFDVLDDVVGTWASDHFAIFQRGDGTLWGFGYNGWGQLGNGTTLEGFTTAATRVLLPE